MSYLPVEWNFHFWRKNVQLGKHFSQGEIFAIKRLGMETKMFHPASHYYLDTN